MSETKIKVLQQGKDYADWKESFIGLLRRKELTYVLEVDKWNKTTTVPGRNTTKKVKGRIKDEEEIEIEVDDDDVFDPTVTFTATKEYFIKSEKIKGYLQIAVSPLIWKNIKKLDSPKDMLEQLDKLLPKKHISNWTTSDIVPETQLKSIC